MKRIGARGLLATVALTALLAAPNVRADETRASAAPPIPYKTEPSPIEAHGQGLVLGLFVLVCVAGGALYLLRRHMPQLQKLTSADGKKLQVVDKLRLN